MVFDATKLMFSYNNDDISDVFESASNYTWDATRGYYNNNASLTLGIGIKQYVNNNIYAVKGTFTGYANTPSGCLGITRIKVLYTDVTESYIGVRDPSGGSTQNIHKGDAGEEIGASRDVVGETYTLTLNGAKTLDTIEHQGGYYSGLPASNRGMKDLKIAYGSNADLTKTLSDAERHFIKKWNGKKKVA